MRVTDNSLGLIVKNLNFKFYLVYFYKIIFSLKKKIIIFTKKKTKLRFKILSGCVIVLDNLSAIKL